mmetsp:Transcript_4399/g.13953  ORF Transcript_4399/g.13953 Transcript_4399/m.13953 type:complete len:94 (-) Transcript_4399:4518-4799(-)
MELLITAGLDGWLRCWDLYINPIYEFSIASEHGISCARVILYKAVADGVENLICDSKGKLIRVPYGEVFSRTREHDAIPRHSLATFSQSEVKN